MSVLDIIAPSLTPKVRNLAMGRLLGGEALITAGEKVSEEDRSARKLAIILVRQINPHEDLNEAEEALLRGMSLKALRAAKQAKTLKPIF